MTTTGPKPTCSCKKPGSLDGVLTQLGEVIEGMSTNLGSPPRTDVVIIRDELVDVSNRLRLMLSVGL